MKKTSSQIGNAIDLGNAQEFIDSATNALQQGQRQFLTPPELASACAQLLPTMRPTALDLSMGKGDLLATSGAHNLLGLDIHRAIARKPNGSARGRARGAVDGTRGRPVRPTGGCNGFFGSRLGCSR